MTVTGLGFDPKICGLVGARLKFGWQWVNNLPSLKLTASLVLKRGWLEDEISFWGPAYFQGLCWFQGPYRDGNMWNTQNQAAKAIGAAALAEIEGTSRCAFGFFRIKKSTELNKSTESTLSFEYRISRINKFILWNSWNSCVFFVVCTSLKSPAINGKCSYQYGSSDAKVPRPLRSWLSVTSMSAMKKTRVARKVV